jgi:serine/threonine protein kinase
VYAQPAADDLMPPEIIGGYRLLRPLGKGGMGTVYEAEDTASGPRVALKLIAPLYADSRDAVERSSREGRFASTISSALSQSTVPFVGTKTRRCCWGKIAVWGGACGSG